MSLNPKEFYIDRRWRAPVDHFKQRLAEINAARGLPPHTRHNGEGCNALVKPRSHHREV